jgi:hypothetical protein
VTDEHQRAADDAVPWFDNDDSDDDDFVEINLREPSDVAGRLLVLVALARRGFLEQHPEQEDAESPETERFDLNHWLAEEKLTSWSEPEEMNVLQTPVGKLTDDDAVDATWSIEAAAALAWALEKIPQLPPFDEATDAASVIDAIPAPWSRTTEFRNSARLRDEIEIARVREQAELWADRADTYWWQQAAAGVDDSDQTVVEPTLEEIQADIQSGIAETAAEAHAAGLIPPPDHDDFPTRFGPFGMLTPEDVEELELIATQRLRALNWLCGLVDNE